MTGVQTCALPIYPPFGFALFYLRGIADTLFKNKALPRKVESKDIYLGAIPWVLMQLVLVAIVIFFPQTVTTFLDKPQVLDLEKAGEDIRKMEGGQSTPPPESGASEAQGAGTGNADLDAASRPASEAEGAASDAGDDDPMKALEEAMKKDAAGGKKP